MATVVLLNKPFGVHTRFTGAGPNLSDYVDVPGVYAAGRLDRDSEGLLVLTDDGALQHRLSHPRFEKWKAYWVQVEREPDEEALDRLRLGVVLKDGPTRPARIARIAEPAIWPRDPPVRFRKSVPTAWLEVQIREGRNRQVRRMTAAIGFPTLRLIRWRVGPWELGALQPGASRSLTVDDPIRR